MSCAPKCRDHDVERGRDAGFLGGPKLVRSDLEGRVDRWADERDLAHAEFDKRPQEARGRFRLKMPRLGHEVAAHALEGSRWTEWVTEVLPQDMRVENKRRLSAFYPTDLDFLLRWARFAHILFVCF